MIINERVNEPAITNDPQSIAYSLRYLISQLNLILQRIHDYTRTTETDIEDAAFDVTTILVNKDGDVLTNESGEVLLG